MKNVWHRIWISYSCSIVFSTITILLLHYALGINGDNSVKLLTCMTLGAIPASLISPCFSTRGWERWIFRMVGVFSGCLCYSVFFIIFGVLRTDRLLKHLLFIGVWSCISLIVFFIAEIIAKKQMEKINAKLQEQADE